MSDSTKKQHASVLWWMFLLQHTSVFLYTKYLECLKLENKSAIEIIYCNYGNVLVDLVVSLLRLLYRCKFFMISWKDPHYDICPLSPNIAYLFDDHVSIFKGSSDQGISHIHSFIQLNEKKKSWWMKFFNKVNVWTMLAWQKIILCIPNLTVLFMQSDICGI